MGNRRPGTKAGNSPVIAVVNGQDITAEDYQEEAAALSPYAMKALEDPKNKEKFLENLEDKRLIVQKAESMGLDKDPEMAAKLNRLKDTLLLGEFVKKEILEKANVTDQDVKAYFDQHKADLGAVRISHILVASQQEARGHPSKAQGRRELRVTCQKILPRRENEGERRRPRLG